MIVEFIGSTGAGKTTLIAAVQRRLGHAAEVKTSFDLVAAPLGLHGMTHSTVKNLMQEVLGLPFFLCALPWHRAFIVFVLRMLARQASFTFFTVNILRSLERKIGIYEIARRYAREQIVLVDEGTVLVAHNIFVYTSELYTPEEITKFARLVPLPDGIVYIRAPLDDLIHRALLRADPPREMKSKNRGQIERYVKRAVSIFEQLVKAEEIRDRVLIVENPEATAKNREAIVNDIAEFICSKHAQIAKCDYSSQRAL